MTHASTAPTRPVSLSVGQVAEAADVAPSAVRFYESHGVLHADRTASNQRRFDESAPCRIQVARLAQRVGLTVREIAELFAALPAEPAPQHWAEIADRLIAEAERRVQVLRQHLTELSSGARLCEIGAALDGDATEAVRMPAGRSSRS